MQLTLPSLDFGELDYKKIGSWPIALRLSIILISVLLILYFGYSYIANASEEIRQQEMASLELLKKEFYEKYKIAAQLSQYQAYLAKLQEQYYFLVKTIPLNNQTPQIISELSRIGTRYSLINRAILPQKFEKKEFFYEEPIDISFEGTYKNILAFVDYLNNAKNFVKFGDFTLEPVSGTAMVGAVDPKLIFTVKIFTYWRPPNEFQA